MPKRICTKRFGAIKNISTIVLNINLDLLKYRAAQYIVSKFLKNHATNKYGYTRLKNTEKIGVIGCVQCVLRKFF
jgi:hypothetical protein